MWRGYLCAYVTSWWFLSWSWLFYYFHLQRTNQVPFLFQTLLNSCMSTLIREKYSRSYWIPQICSWSEAGFALNLLIDRRMLAFVTKINAKTILHVRCPISRLFLSQAFITLWYVTCERDIFYTRGSMQWRFTQSSGKIWVRSSTRVHSSENDPPFHNHTMIYCCLHSAYNWIPPSLCCSWSITH